MLIDYQLAEQSAATRNPIYRVFSISETVSWICRVEAALAKVQAARGIIPAAAAQEIQRKALSQTVDITALRAEIDATGHPFLGVLRAWSRELEGDAAQWVHYGATTADIFNTVLILQIRRAATLMLEQMREIETQWIALALAHRQTPMISRTLGRHALPITFGMKLASWLAEHDRSIRRLRQWLSNHATGIMSGAVGSYAAFGPDGPAIEAEVMAELGLKPPEAADWKGSRDRYAEFGAALAIAARGYGRLAQEIFLLQGDDIREVDEANPGIGSSTMPHKSNPLLCIDIMSRCREVSAELPTLLEWMMTLHDRDSSWQDPSLQRMCQAFARTLDMSRQLADRLVVHPANMLRNLHRTQGHILAEDLVFRLAPKLGKAVAHELLHATLREARTSGISLQDAIAAQPALAAEFDADALSLPPPHHIALCAEVTDRALAAIERRRNDPDGNPA